MQTAVLIMAGYLGFAAAIAVLWNALAVSQRRQICRSRLEDDEPRTCRKTQHNQVLVPQSKAGN